MLRQSYIDTLKQKPESDYLELERLSVKLGIPVPFTFISLSVEKAGCIISSYRQRSRTWNRNYWNQAICATTRTPGVITNFGAGYLSAKQVPGTVAAISADFMQRFDNVGIINNSTYGLLAGIGTTAESFEGFALSKPITHGSGSGQLVYAAHSALAQSYVSGTKTWTITIKRLMNNNSGTAIVVAETAIVAMNINGYYYMFCRDLLGSTVSVANGAQLTISYDVSLTFPE